MKEKEGERERASEREREREKGESLSTAKFGMTIGEVYGTYIYIVRYVMYMNMNGKKYGRKRR